jgi:hypothetical protein
MTSGGTVGVERIVAILLSAASALDEGLWYELHMSMVYMLDRYSLNCCALPLA